MQLFESKSGEGVGRLFSKQQDICLVLVFCFGMVFVAVVVNYLAPNRKWVLRRLSSNVSKKI